MKRSKAIHLVLLASAAAMVEGCGRNQCVDGRDIVVDDRFCQGQSAGYHFYNGGAFNYAPMGSHVSSTGTSRGVFGSAGESAHGGGAGSGE